MDPDEVMGHVVAQAELLFAIAELLPDLEPVIARLEQSRGKGDANLPYTSTSDAFQRGYLEGLEKVLHGLHAVRASRRSTG